MTLCVIDGGHCLCQPQEGTFCVNAKTHADMCKVAKAYHDMRVWDGWDELTGERERFEDWALLNGAWYGEETLHFAWFAWQARAGAIAPPRGPQPGNWPGSNEVPWTQAQREAHAAYYAAPIAQPASPVAQPVAWMHNCERDKDCDAEPGAVISAKSKAIWMEVDSKWVSHYTIPLYAAPVDRHD